MLTSNSSNRTTPFQLDGFVVLCYFILLAIGLVSICGSTGTFEATDIFANGSRPVKQLIWVGISLGVVFLLLFVNSQFFNSFAPVIYLFFILLLIGTLFLAPDIKGSRSWLVIGSFRLQPAEFAKLATALMLSSVFDRYGFQLKGSKAYLQVFSIILLPAFIILMQQEAGSALIFSVFILVLYREGLPGFYLSIGSFAVILFIALLYTSDLLWGSTRADYFVGATLVSIATLVFLYHIAKKKRRYHVKRLVLSYVAVYLVTFTVGFFVPLDQSYTAVALLMGTMLYVGILALYYLSRRYFFTLIFALSSTLFAMSVSFVYEEVLQPHQQDRIAVALGIKEDFHGAGYNVNQAKIAIGSGGLTGKGFMKGTQTKLNYVPEQDTDFIFCTVGEEYGFLGSIFVLLVFLVLLLRILILAERQPNTFARLYGYCVAGIFLFHLCVNIGMVLGLVPVVGIPLPFISYGGSSLLSSTLLLYLFLIMDRDNKRLPAYKRHFSL